MSAERTSWAATVSCSAAGIQQPTRRPAPSYTLFGPPIRPIGHADVPGITEYREHDNF